MRNRKAGIIYISKELLEQALNLPEEAHIEKVFQDHEMEFNRSFGLIISGPMFPEVHEGERIPQVGYEIIENYRRNIEFDF